MIRVTIVHRDETGWAVWASEDGISLGWVPLPFTSAASGKRVLEHLTAQSDVELALTTNELWAISQIV